MTQPILKLNNVTTHYGPLRVLSRVNVEVGKNEIVCLLGGNASGKSTTMKTILGIVKPTSGSVEFMGGRIDGLPTHTIVRRGISPVPEARRIFARLSVKENLEMGAFIHRKSPDYHIGEEMEKVFDLFPKLKQRLIQDGSTLSGGEQQMLALGRGLMSHPELLLLDEPSLGLAPLVVNEIYRVVREINKSGITILLVEQNINMAMKVSSYAYILETGRISTEGKPHEVMKKENIMKAYLGE